MKAAITLYIIVLFMNSGLAQNFTENVELKQQYIQISGKLFEDVQLSGIFRDSKTFVDAVPLFEPDSILQKYNDLQLQPDFDLLQFVSANFDIPQDSGKEDSIYQKQNMREHIRSLWGKLSRSPAERKKYSTLLTLEYPYVVPGGRFREVYYWDSYFTILGLLADKREKEVENMIRNFSYLLEEYGMIPNGNRVYYLTRSQPPFFSLMVDIMCRYKNNYEWGGQFLNALETEYRFWMNGAEKLKGDVISSDRVVRLNDSGVLNRYFDFDTIPREESFREDHSLGLQVDSNYRPIFLKHLRAGAESGWDFSSRWFKDTFNIKTVRTTDILPVDLNCLLYFLEVSLAKFHKLRGNLQEYETYTHKAGLRRKLINEIFWDDEKGYFFDYDYKAEKTTGIYSLAGIYPLFFNAADDEKAERAAQVINDQFLEPGGLVSTIYDTGQQWDAPNGWAPLQWLGIVGLRQYGFNELADEIKSRWNKLNEAVYQRTGKMFEKYNVQDLSLYAGGGEYPLQDGFGWTNGVAAALLDNFDLKYTARKE